jgi:REP element-mobilizing transposase RayT
MPGFDYSSSNWYYVTICTHERECLFGNVINGEQNLNLFGQIINMEWLKLRVRFLSITLGASVIMPNHLHGIIILNNGRENPTPTLGQIIAYFKYQTTKEYNRVGAGFSRPCDHYNKLWQRNYYEHIIRDEGELNFSQYIEDNPRNWGQDELFA